MDGGNQREKVIAELKDGESKQKQKWAAESKNNILIKTQNLKTSSGSRDFSIFMGRLTMVTKDWNDNARE